MMIGNEPARPLASGFTVVSEIVEGDYGAAGKYGRLPQSAGSLTRDACARTKVGGSPLR